jgi:hypothetical protein
MDERRTLSILGMILGSLVGALFVLDAIALSDTASTAIPQATASTATPQATAAYAEQAGL